MDQDRWTAVLAQRERLLRLAHSRGVSGEDASDVVQEAMLRCAEFEPLDPERLGQFLTTVTVRLCADVHRRNQEPVRARRWLAPLLCDEPDPADLICRDHGPEWVESLLERLPERQRHVIFDRARGLTIQQIAVRHRLTYKAAESALARARAALRVAVTTSMSVAAFLTRRTRGPEVAVTASAAAFIVSAAILVSPTAPDPVTLAPAPGQRADVVADHASPVPVPVTGPTPRPWVPQPSPTPAPHSAPASRLPAPSPTDGGPVPTFTITASPVGGIAYREDGYRPGEHVLHCVQYGISTYPTLRCNYPTPTPGDRP